MDVLGIIPARGGSKAIPRKNIALLGGRPLLAYTCEAALASRSLTRVILSTDDAEIADVGRACGVEVPFMRPAELAGDHTPAVDVLRHALATLCAHEGYAPASVVVLQPTSPLRKAEHIDAAVDILVRSGADAVVSVIEVPHQFALASLMRLEGERLLPLPEGPPILRRQDKPRMFARNGPAVLAVRREVVEYNDSLYGGHCRALVMDPEASVDVDGPFDLQFAEFLLARRRGSGTRS